LLLAGTLLLTGCGDLMSLEPLATKENTIFDAALLGTWTDSKDTLCVVRAANPAYNIVWIGTGDDGDKIRLEGRLVKLGEERVLDVSAVDPGAFSVAAHVFLRVRISRGTMELRFLDSDWLQQQVKQSSLAYSVIGEGHPIITAPPAQLLTFLQQFGLKEEAMDKPILLTRLVPQR
jgi:hypothetical protein